jgi:ACS family glucarate transporter-like MFS transporter
MSKAWRLVALLSVTATASYLCRVNVSVTGVMMMRELGLSQEAMGRIFSAFLLGYALCQIPGGMLADRFGAARVLGWAALAWVAATLWIA